MGWIALSSILFGYSGGTGQLYNPYQIANVNDLLELAATTSDYTKHFILTADIDLDPNLSGGQVFTSAIIAPDISSSGGFQGTPFEGTFDGNDHNLYNLTIGASTNDYIGLFGYINQGQVKNLRLENISLTVSNWSAGVVGSGAILLDGLDDYIEIEGYKGVTGSQSRTVTAWINADVSTDGAIVMWGDDSIAGGKWLFRINSGGQLRVSASGGYAVATTDLRGTGWHHVAVVLTDDETVTTDDIQFYVDGILEPLSSVASVAINTTDIANVSLGATTTATLLFKGMMDDVKIYDRALIQTEIFVEVDENPVAHWQLDGDATDASGYGHHGTVYVDANPYGKRNYVGGLSGYISQSSISNCFVTGTAVGNGSLCLGGLAGFSMGSTMTNCHSNVALGGTGFNVGGLVGSSIANSAISNCSAEGTITETDLNGSGFSVGGLVGNNCSSSISHCRATGDITVISTSTGSSLNMNIGGLTGENRYGTITHSYATGSINTAMASESAITCVGGLAGLSSSQETSDSYAKGSVLFNCSTESDYFIGGMVGLNYDGSMSRCYSAGIVGSSGNPQADNCVGGFCGDAVIGVAFEDTANFWDMETSDKTASAMGTDKTTNEMKAMSTFTSAGWDFATIWTIYEGTNYPRQQWQIIPTGDWVSPDGVGVEDLSLLSSCWLEMVQVQADINDDDVVNFEDFQRLSQNWLLADCGTCNNADITDDGNVNELDLGLMTEQWLFFENAACRLVDLNADDTIDLSDWAIFAGNWMEGF